MRDSKIALITLGKNNIERGQLVAKVFKQLNYRYDWYTFEKTEDYDLSREIEDLKQSYEAVYII